MNLSAPFIFRPIMTILLMLAIVVFGVFAYKKLPVSDLPNIDYPTLTVSAHQPGGSLPQYMADSVAAPLERRFAAISGLSSMTSKNTIGSTTIVLNFELDTNIQSKEVEVQQAITASLPDLPPMPYNPTYALSNPTQTPILFFVLTSKTATLAEMYNIAYDQLSQPLAMIEGVAGVNTYGYPFAVRIQADPMKLYSYGLDLNQLTNALITANPNLPAGALSGPYFSTVVQSNGQLFSAREFDEIIIKENKGTPLKLKDVANAVDGLNNRSPFFRYVTPTDNVSSVAVGVTRLPGSNTLQITNEIYKKMEYLRDTIPGSMELTVFYDKAASITTSVRDVQLTLIIALLLVVVVIYLYLGKLLETLIPSLVLPMSILSSFILMFMLGFNLDTLSLLALTLAIGFVIDDSIVVLENIVRHVESGKTPLQAAIDGSKQISTTVFTMTIALASVFIPLIWMPGILGRTFHEFSLTIVVAIFCSGFISLTLNPMLCSRFLRTSAHYHSEKKGFLMQQHAKLLNVYERYLKRSLHYPRTMLLIGLGCLVLSIVMFTVLPTDFLPPSNLDLVEGIAKMAEGTGTKNTIRHLEKLNLIIQKYPYQDRFLSIAGPTSDAGILYIHLLPAGKRPTASKVSLDLMHQLSEVPGINAYLRAAPLIDLQVGSSSSIGDYQYVLKSNNTRQLYDSALEMTRKMQSIPGLIGVNNDMKIKSPQLDFNIDRDRAGRYGIDARSIESILQYAYSKGRISTFNRGTNLNDLIVEVAPGWDLSERDIDLLYVTSKTTGLQLPLASLATWKLIAGPAEVNHINTFPAVTISFGLAKGASLGTALTEINKLAKEVLPLNVVGTVQGGAETFITTFKTMGILLIVSIIAIYILLGILYESFIHPLTILSALPVACLGGLLTLWLFGQSLSLFSIVGMIVLIGLVQKNGIMMIDFALEHLETKGTSPEEAIIEACKARFRPIIMTTLAAMMGALPVAIGIGANAEMNQPVGLVIFGGLFFSQLLTLFITPVVFLYMQRFEEKFRFKKFPKPEPLH